MSGHSGTWHTYSPTTKDFVGFFGIIVVAVCMYLGIHESARELNLSNALIWTAACGMTFFLFRGPTILYWHRIRRRVYWRYDPVFWAAFPTFAISGFLSSANTRAIQVIAIVIAAMLYLIGCKRTRDWYFEKAEEAVTAVRCPTHKKNAHFELRHNGKRQYMWVEGCCEEAKDVAKVAAQEVFCS